MEALAYPISVYPKVGSPGVLGSSPSNATDYERVFDTISDVVRTHAAPVVRITNPLGIHVGPSAVKPSSIALNETSVAFSELSRMDYRGCASSRGPSDWSWTLFLDFPAWVSLESLDKKLVSISVKNNPDSGLPAFNILATSRRVVHPKYWESDGGTSATYTFTVVRADQPRP